MNQDVLDAQEKKIFPDEQTFRHPEPRCHPESIYPIFIPFSGCVKRCVFCAQHIQTGQPALDEPDQGEQQKKNAIGQTLAKAEQDLLNRRARNLPQPKAAFYGGTFTAQPEPILNSCLEAGERWLREGLVCGLRCSTRPDAVNEAVLSRLKKAGFSCLELGVQSFCDNALDRAGRGYDQKTALAACIMVRESGFSLGVQLMPGLPGQSRAGAMADVNMAASLRPDFVRIYPCLVLESTPLASWWRQGLFTPWELQETADFLAAACLAFWREGVVVARMGLAEDPGLVQAVLAGPRHPALGNMARSRGLLRMVADAVAAIGQDGPYAIAAPRRYQGEFFGFRGELRAGYASMGIKDQNISFVNGDLFTVRKLLVESVCVSI